MISSFTFLALFLGSFIGIICAQFTPSSYLSAELCASGAISSKVVTKNDIDYNNVRMGERTRIQRYPLVIAYPVNSTQVQNLILCARYWKKVPCVRNGGHSNEGYSSIDDSIVIDLKYMNNFEYDVTSGIATVQGGIRLGPLYLELDAYNQTIVSADSPTVGLSGSISSGGFGIQSRKYGVSGDFVVEAEVVLANGTIIIANNSSNSDLLWALRGGGGSFGIVTQWKLKTIQAWTEVTNFNADFDIGAFNLVLKSFSNWAYNANYNLSTILHFSNKELRITGSGISDCDTVRKWLFEIELFKTVGNVKLYKQTCNHLQSRAYFLDDKNIRQKNCTQKINLLNIGIDPLEPNITVSPPDIVTEGVIHTIPPGFKQNREMVKVKSFFFEAGLNDSDITILNNLRVTMPDGAYAELTSYGGYLGTMSTNFTAFRHRNGTAYHLLLSVPLTGNETDNNARLNYVKQWEDNVRPISNGYSYQGYIDGDFGDQYGQRYYGENYKRLEEIKSLYDPINVFTNNQSVQAPPSNSSTIPSLPNSNQCPLGFLGGYDPPGRRSSSGVDGSNGRFNLFCINTSNLLILFVTIIIMWQI